MNIYRKMMIGAAIILNCALIVVGLYFAAQDYVSPRELPFIMLLVVAGVVNLRVIVRDMNADVIKLEKQVHMARLKKELNDLTKS